MEHSPSTSISRWRRCLSFLLLIATLFVASTAFAQDPSVTITSPSSGSSFGLGTSISFVANATDDLDDPVALTASIAWVSSVDGPIGTGGSINVGSLSAGPHTITASVTDSNGNPGSDSINVTITNNSPNVTITSPGSGSSFSVGASINFVANATDVEDNNAALTAAIAWSSNRDGSIGTGGSINVSSLSAGAHTITASVTDSNGNPGSDSIAVSVTNSAPVITITAPANGSSFDFGASINFVANATDVEDNNATLTAAIAWSSNINGAIGSGGSINVSTLSQGAHTITASVTDSNGNPGSASINVTIANNAPSVTITSPADGSSFNSGVSINFVANATDVEDNDATLTAAITWSSSIDGALGSGGSINVDTLSAGDHDITAAVTDSDGSGGSASINVTINNVAPVITGQTALTTQEEVGLELLLSNFTISDPDSTIPDDMTLLVQDGVNYSRSGNVITPANDFNGNLTVPVIVNDGFSNSAPFNATVSVTPVNDRPIIAAQQPLSTQEDSSIAISLSNLTIVDPDSNNFTLQLFPGPNHTVAGTVVAPVANFNGNLNVPATVTDDSGAINATSAQVNLQVSISAVNDSPTLVAPIANQNAVEASSFNLNISGNFADVDGDTLRFSIGANELPASGNITFNGNTGVFSGTPQLEDARDNAPYIINVTATDNQPGTVPAVDQFELVIAALDRANVSLDITVTPDPAMQNDQLRWTYNVRNAPGQQGAADVELNGSFFGSGLSASSQNGCTIQPPSGQVTNFNCIVGAIPPGGTTSLVLTTDTTEVGDVATFAVAAGVFPVPIDPNMEDNSAQLAVGVAEAFSNGAVQFLGNANVLSVATGDFDGDGSEDLVVGTAAGQPVQIYLSSGFRDFSTTPISIADNNANEGVATADFDQNGTVDIVVANGGGQTDVVYANDGSANFSVMNTLNGTFAQDVAVGDFDNDGNPDIAVATIEANPIYLGNGSGGFTLHRSLGNSNSNAVAVGRFDNNSRDDVVFANVGSPSRVWTKNSGGGFTSADQVNIGDASSVTVGQFGGNSRDDLAFGRIPSGIGDVPANAVLINDGSGNFGNPVELLGAAPTEDIHAGDVNSDGLDDLVFVNLSGVHQIWLADSGTFQLHSEQIADRDSFAGVLTELGFTDVGDPGGVDLAMGGAMQAGVGVFLNDGFGNLGRGDAVPPTLTLLGETSVSVPSGTAYVDAGAAAEDNIDGNISGSIRVTNNVNTSVVGAYTVTYNVSDFAGNAATPIVRDVTVTPATGTGGGGGGSASLPGLIGLFFLFVLCAPRLHVRQTARTIATTLKRYC